MMPTEIRRPRDSRAAEGKGDCQHHLPGLECAECGKTWCETEVWYPSLSIAKGPDPSRFTDEITLNLADLNSLRRQVVGVGKRKLRLVPCAGIGEVKARIPRGASDFVWCGFRLLARKSVVDMMAANGVLLPNGPVKVEAGRAGSADYVALELDSIPMWDELTLKETTIVYCHNCGGYSLQNVRADLNKPKRYVRNRMPKGQGLVRVDESYVTLATDAFVSVFKANKMTGLEFREEGVYV
jgi:hypothetical protein